MSIQVHAMKILQHKVLYRATRFHAAFPSIARFSDDNLLLAFRRARNGLWLVPDDRKHEMDPVHRMDHIDSRSHIALMELDPTGETPIGDLDMLPFDPEAGDQDPSILLLDDDRVFLASMSWYPLPSDVTEMLLAKKPPDERHPGCRYLFWGGHTGLREREPGKWLAHHRYLQPDGEFGGPLREGSLKILVGPIRGQALRRNDEILLPVYSGLEAGCALFVSTDQGESWRHRGRIAVDPNQEITYQEPALCEDGRGGLVCFMRTHGADGRLATTRSTDGVHWKPPVLHDLIGHPFHPLALPDGRVLLSYGYRDEPFGIRVRMLDNALMNPDDAEEIIIRDDGLCSDVGYPWAVQLRDGRVLLVYYWTDGEGTRQIIGTWLGLDR